MMKKLCLLILIWLPVMTNARVKTSDTPQEVSTDSAYSRDVKVYKAASIFKLHYVCGLTQFDHRNSSLVFQPGAAMGADATIGMKLHSKFALGFGAHHVSQRFDQEALKKSVNNYYSDYDFVVHDTAGKSFNRRSTVYIYGSYWLYKPKFVWEFYTKLGISFNTVNPNQVVYRHKTFSNISEYFLLNKPKHFRGFLPAVGANANFKLNKILYACVGAEYGMLLHQADQMQASRFASDGSVEQTTINIPFPRQVFQAHVGLMFRVFNRAVSGEKNYDDQMLQKVILKNN